MTTDEQLDEAAATCREIFEKKMKDYGAAWRILRPTSMTDQIYIKANRIRSIQMKGEHLVEEGIEPEFIGIVNYAAMALIQCKKGFAESPDITAAEATKLYDEQIKTAHNLMNAKNHDYDEAWRKMRISSITDLILMKIHRTKEIEDKNGQTLISEGVEANYLDMINYAIFALIKLRNRA